VVDSLRGPAVRRDAAFAAPASADSADDAFVAAVAKDGIVITDRNAAITMAHTMCAGFDRNEKSSVLAMRLMKHADLSLKQSSYFVGVSISAYCPQYKGLTADSVTWLNSGPRLCERKGHNAAVFA
jgi:Protein of unknown function (DUF732)